MDADKEKDKDQESTNLLRPALWYWTLGLVVFVVFQSIGQMLGTTQVAYSDFKRLVDILLHQQDSDLIGVDAANTREEFSYEQWRQAERRFIQHEQPGLGHESPTDGHHLLFPATERAHELMLSLT